MSWQLASQFAGNLVGSVGQSLFGQDGPSVGEQQNNSLKYLKDSIKLQNNEAIQQRVAAAKATGLHPLSVLGANVNGGATFQTSSKEKPNIDFAALSQGIDRAANANRTSIQRKLDTLALEKAQLSNDYLRTQIAGAQKSIANTAGTKPLRDNTDPTNNVDRVRVVPDEQTSKSKNDTGRTAGKHAAFKLYDLGNGMQMEAPYNEEGWSEAIGEMPFWYKHPKMAEALLKRHYGTSGLAKKNRGKRWYNKEFPTPKTFFGKKHK
jgi:hypothetical protein